MVAMAKIGKQGDGGGRPPRVLNEQELDQVEKLAGLITSEKLADVLGIARTTFYDIMKRQPEVAERYKKGRASLESKIAAGLAKKAIAGDTASQIFYLKTQGGWHETKPEDKSNKIKNILRR